MAGIGKLFKKGRKPPDPPRKDYETRSRSQDNESDEESYLDPTKVHPTLPPINPSTAIMPSYPPPRPQHSPKSSDRKVNGSYSKRSSYPSEIDNRPAVKPRPSRIPGKDATSKPTGVSDDYCDPWDAAKPAGGCDDYCDPVDANPRLKAAAPQAQGKLDDYSDPWDSKQNPIAPPRTRKAGGKDEYIDPWDAKRLQNTQGSKDSDDDSYTEPYDAGKVTALDEQAKRLSLRGMRLPSQGDQLQSPTLDNRPLDDYDSPWESRGLIKPQSVSSSIPSTDQQNKEADSRPVDDYDKPWEWTARKTQQFGIYNGPIPTPQATPQATPKIDSRPADDYDSPWEYNKRTSQLVSMVIDDKGTRPPDQPPVGSAYPVPPKPPRAFAGPDSTGFAIDPGLPLVKQNWYHGPITRVEAERMLKFEGDGSFLVRDSESNRKDYSLSFKNNNAFMHLKISPDVNQKYVLGQFSKPFDRVPEVIHHYSVTKLNIKGAEHKYLKNPVCPQHEYFVLEKS